MIKFTVCCIFLTYALQFLPSKSQAQGFNFNISNNINLMNLGVGLTHDSGDDDGYLEPAWPPTKAESHENNQKRLEYVTKAANDLADSLDSIKSDYHRSGSDAQSREKLARLVSLKFVLALYNLRSTNEKLDVRNRWTPYYAYFPHVFAPIYLLAAGAIAYALAPDNPKAFDYIFTDFMTIMTSASFFAVHGLVQYGVAKSLEMRINFKELRQAFWDKLRERGYELPNAMKFTNPKKLEKFVDASFCANLLKL